MSKSYERVGENNKKYGQSTTIFPITERKTSIHIILYYSDERMTSNDLLRKQADVENHFRCFYCALFKNRAKNGQ